MITLQSEPQEIVRYFSEFLTEINVIIHSIKQHAYQIVEVCIPNPTLLTVYESMASIVSHTYKTFDNLKIIESLLRGIAKSKVPEQPQTPNPQPHRYRSKSLETDLFFYPNHQQRMGQSKLNTPQFATDTRTIKKGHLLQNSSPYGEKSSDLVDIKTDSADKSVEGWKQASNRKRGQAQEDATGQQDQKTVKIYAERGVQSKNDGGRPLKDWKKLISEKISALISNNRSTMSRILDRNMQCLRLVRSVKKECNPK